MCTYTRMVGCSRCGNTITVNSAPRILLSDSLLEKNKGQTIPLSIYYQPRTSLDLYGDRALSWFLAWFCSRLLQRTKKNGGKIEVRGECNSFFVYKISDNCDLCERITARYLANGNSPRNVLRHLGSRIANGPRATLARECNTNYANGMGQNDAKLLKTEHWIR